MQIYHLQIMQKEREQTKTEDWLFFRKQDVESITFRQIRARRKNQTQFQVEVIKFNENWWKDLSLTNAQTKLLQSGLLSSYKYRFLQSMYLQLPPQQPKNKDRLKKLFRQKINEFRFDDPKNVLFLGSTQSWIEPISFNQTNPLLSLRLAQSAYLIIRDITQGQYANMSKRISEFWDLSSQPIGKLNEKLKEATIQAVGRLKGMFSVMDSKDRPFSIESQIYKQQRFEEGASKSYTTIFHPTSTTKQIFQTICIQNIQKCQETQKKIYVYGQSGIGKSFSSSLLVELHNIIIDFRIKLPTNIVLRQIDKNFEWQKFERLPKYFYFNFGRLKFSYSKFLEVIGLQIPKFVLQDCINLQGQLDIKNVVSWYKRRHIEVVFIIDQINFYFSLARREKQRSLKVQNNYQKTIIEISQLLTSLSRYNVIFLASENAQISIFNNSVHYFSFQEYQIELKKIEFEPMTSQEKEIKETLSTILFQIQNQTMVQQKQGQKAIILIREKIKQFESIQKMNINAQLRQYLSAFTHQRVKLFFKKNPLRLRYKLLDQDSVLTLFQQIHKFIIKEYSQKYRRFVFQKSDTETKREKFLNVIKMRAEAEKIYKRNLLEDYFDFKFGFSFWDNQYQQLFKGHAQFLMKQSVRIYLSPKLFLQITQFINENIGLFASLFNQVIRICGVNPFWIGTTFEAVHINIFSQYNIKLKLGQVYTLNSARIDCNDRKFQHFVNMISPSQRQNSQRNLTKRKCKIEKKTSVYIRFYKLFKTLASIQVMEFQQICAVPQIRTVKFDAYSSDFSSNSQSIDFLIIKCLNKRQIGNNGQPLINTDQEDHYELDTFDFCVSYTKAYIDYKVDRAKIFFKKFLWIAELQNTNDGQNLVNQLLKQ